MSDPKFRVGEKVVFDPKWHSYHRLCKEHPADKPYMVVSHVPDDSHANRITFIGIDLHSMSHTTWNVNCFIPYKPTIPKITVSDDLFDL